MITTIYQYLNADNKLCQLLNHNQYEDSLKIFFGRPSTNNKKQLNEKGSFIDYPYLVYNIVPFSQNEVTNDNRLQITVVTDNELKLNDINNRLIELLDFKKNVTDRPSNRIADQVILNSQLMTGGSFFYHKNEQVFEQIKYFLVKMKG
ncbi:hypothetical protein [Halalkalibacter sp. APA_J-10(15)]|uniref:hypothetical protein n=1 Tax=Halalkalibacter sp. APA_J-10(15) TaxID=2933805 RepID=UPI001FF3B249|nr:hypothetical protein [Halalkalibacter sp. APA_J-10(15)]MCK0470891.1 hypothetical protein [Halalkalibacter sp. APA_J-10(15)]